MPAVVPKSEKQQNARSSSEPAPETPQLECAEGARAGLPQFMGGGTPDLGTSPVFMGGRSLTTPRIQSKLTVGSVNDPLEDEADRIADQMTGMPDSAAFAADRPARIRREPAPERSNSRAPDGAVPEVVHDVLRSPGQQLGEPIRAYFEPRFQRDFSHVRVHADTQAAHSAQAIQARAYTAGNDVVFAGGEFSPGSVAGTKLLAHELTHVVQQTGPAPLFQAEQPPEEGKATAIARQPVVQRAPLVTQQNNGEERIARKSDDEGDITAAEYESRFADEIGNGVLAAIGELPLETGSRYVTLASPVLLGPAILGDSGASLTKKIEGWLGRDKLGVLINKARPKGRVEVTDEKDTWVEDKQGEGPARWFPDVGVEVAQVVHKLLHESLARITPRYIQAAVAVGVAEEERRQQSLVNVPAPMADDIVPSHPIDPNTIGVLIQFARFDYLAYRAANPSERGKVGQIRPVFFCWEAPRTGSYWIRVSSPADATAEEVAQALYGSPTFAGKITVSAAPLFGIADASQLLPAHQQTLASFGVDTGFAADPVKEALTGPLHDEIAKNQSKAPSHLLTKTDVVRTIDQSVMILDSIAKSGGRFGMGKGPYVESVKPLKQRLIDRRTAFMSGSDEMALAWASQAEAQQSVLSDISFGFDRHVTRLNDLTKMVENAAQKLGGFNLPQYVRMAMLEVAMKFADAAVASELPETARAILAEAEDRAGTLPVEFLEGALESIQRVIDDARTAKAGEDRWAAYDVGDMQAREQKYKLQLAKIRALIRTDPAAATKELGEVQKLILDLQIESELVGNMDAIDSAWKALDDAYSFWFSSIPTTVILRQLKAEGDGFHARWRAIHKAWKTGDATAKEQAKKDLDALRADPELPAYFGKVKEAVKNAQTEALIGKIVALLVITVVTMGVGDIVAAGLAGWELGAGWTAVAVGGAEAFTFTLLSQVFLDNDHSFGHIVYEFGSNWAMFGVLRRFQAFAEIAKLGTVAKFGGQAVLLGAMTFAKADLDVYIKEGRHLNKEEVKQIALQGIAMYIAMHAIAPAAKPLFADLESGAYTFSAKLKANNRVRIALETQANALQSTKDFAAAQKYVSAEKAWLEQRIQVLEEMEAQLQKEEADPNAKKDGGLGGKIKLNSSDLASLKSELKANLEKVAGAEQPLLYLEPKAPGLFSCPREHIVEVVKSLGETTKVTEDPATGVKTYEIMTPDGNAIKVVEALDPKTQWVQDFRAGLDGVQRARFDAMTSGLSPNQVYERFGGSVDRAKATAAGVELPGDLLDLRSGLSDAARTAFDAKFRSSLRDPAKPAAKEVEAFRKTLEAIRQKNGGDLQKGLEAEAATMKKPFDPSSCFIAGTVVWTAETPRPIETLAAGDLVLATDTWNFGQSPQQVADATVRTVSSLVDIDIGGTTISCSPEHPFYVPQMGWRQADALEPGVALLGMNGAIPITAVRHRHGAVEVFNLEVAELSAYHVSPLGILVHNKARAHDFYKDRKGIVDALEANAKTAAELDAAMSTTGETGKVDATKRTDLAERLAKVKKNIASLKKSAADLTLAEEELIEPAAEEQLKIGDELDALTGEIGEAKKPFDQRMRELNQGIANVDKRLQELSASNDKAAEDAQTAKSAAGADAEKAKAADKKVAGASARTRKISALKERLAALKRGAGVVQEDPTSDSGIGAYKNEVSLIEGKIRDLEEELRPEEMLGAKGPQFTSKTLWTGPDGHERIDAENPDPGGRPGQIHYQPNPYEKWYYDPKNDEFYDENRKKVPPKSVQDKLKDPDIRAAINEALRQLAGKPKP